MKLGPAIPDRTPAALADEVRSRTGINPAQCYQCGKCTAGCPMTFAMDLDPARVMRLVQLGQREEVLKSHTIWLCASCETCTTRCPQEIDTARVMDALRIIAREAGYTKAEKEIAAANRGLLASVRGRGRVHETIMVMLQNITTGHPLRDVEKGPTMMLKGKMSPFAHRSGKADQVRRLFENVDRIERGDE